MSSETSIERKADPSGSATFQPWQLFTLAALVGATAVVFVSRSSGPAGVIVLSVTVGAAAFAGLAAFRTFAPLVGREETGPEMLGGRTKAALEREKSLVLRSIKDLEFDHAMHKVSDKDFEEMGVRLRLRAARLLRQLDQGTSYRQEIEREIVKRLGVAPAARARGCAACGATNDADAKFCKGCGTQLEMAG